MHPTESALLAAVLANPADDLPRLVMADWLEENGQPERAAWIRIQCELERTMPDRRPWYISGNWSDKVRPTSRQNLERHIWAKAVESEEVFDWFRVFDHDFASAAGVARINGGNPDTYDTDDRLAIVRRGFISEVRCTLADWCGGECPTCHDDGHYHAVNDDGTEEYFSTPCNCQFRTTGIGPAVVRSHPVERVVVTDKSPRPNTQELPDVMWWGWYLTDHPGERYDLPIDLRDYIGTKSGASVWRQYHTPEEATAALSVAAIAWAKSQPHPARIDATPVSVEITSD